MKTISIGDKLRQLRQSKKLSQKQLAEALFVQHTTISNWEKDVRKINLDQLQQIASYFDVELSFFQQPDQSLPFTVKKQFSNSWITAIAVGSIVLSSAAFILVNRSNPIPAASCYGEEDCEYINDPSIVNELTERSITGGVMTNVELDLVHTLMNEFAWVEQDSLNVLSNKQYVERVLDTINLDFELFPSHVHDAMYQYFLNSRTIATYEYLAFESINTENKQLIVRNNTKYVLFKSGEAMFTYEVFDPQFVYRYTIDLSLDAIYAQDTRLVEAVETKIKDLIHTSYSRAFEDLYNEYYLENIPSVSHQYYLSYRREKSSESEQYDILAYDKSTSEIYRLETYFSFQQITFHIMTKEGFFFYPFSPSTPVMFSSLVTFIESLVEADLNALSIEGEIDFSGAKSLFFDHFSAFPFETIDTTINSL